MQQSYSICVFCGASPNVEQKYIDKAILLGKLIAEKNYKLIYGGGSVGLMGAISNSVIQNGGKVLGIYPKFLQPDTALQSIEPANQNLTELVIVNDLSSRKILMAKEANCFLILPGGFGTLDEAFEVITWKYLNNFEYPIIFYNQDGFYNKLFEMIDEIYEKKFANKEIAKTYQLANNIEEILELINTHRFLLIDANI